MKKRNLPKRVKLSTRVNGIYHDTLVKKGPRASITKNKKKIIVRHQKYKNDIQ